MDTTEIPTPQPGCDGDPLTSITERWADLLGCTKSMCALMRSFNSSIDIGYAPMGLGEQVWAELTTLSNLVDAARISITPAIVASGRWKTEGSKSPEDWLAGKTGSSTGKARTQLETGKNLRKAPGTQESFLNGEISAEQADTIADAVEANPAAEDDLLDQAKRDSLKNLKDEAARRKAEVEDIEERERRLHRKRYVRQWTDKEGAWNLRARGPIPSGSEFMAVLEGLIDQQFKKARKTGIRGTRDNYAYDALMDLANQHGWGHGTGNIGGTGGDSGPGGPGGTGPSSDGTGGGSGDTGGGSGPSGSRGASSDGSGGTGGGTGDTGSGRRGNGGTGNGTRGSRDSAGHGNGSGGHSDESTHRNGDSHSGDHGTSGNETDSRGRSDGSKRGAPTHGRPTAGESASSQPTAGDSAPESAKSDVPGPGGPTPGSRAPKRTGSGDPAPGLSGRSDSGQDGGSRRAQNTDPFEPVESERDCDNHSDSRQTARGGTCGRQERTGEVPDAPTNDLGPTNTSISTGEPEPEVSENFEGRLFDLEPASDNFDDPPQQENQPQPMPPGRTQATTPKQRIFCIDWSALARGRIHPGERCELRGVGMVSVRAIRQALVSGTARMVVTDTNDRVVTVAMIGTGAINGRLFPMGSPNRLRLEAPDAADLTVAEASAQSGPSAVIVRVRLTDLNDPVDLNDLNDLNDVGTPSASTASTWTNGRTVDLAGVGPVEQRRLTDLLGSELAGRLAERGTAIRAITHTGRAPSAAQRVALAWADTTCKVPGCHNQRVEIDHRNPWAADRVTKLDNLDPLCAHHHSLKTHEGWAFAESNTRSDTESEYPQFVPPTDRRHPNGGAGSSRAERRAG